MLQVEQIERIRRAYYVEEKSIRTIAKELGHSRETVKKAVASAEARHYTLRKERAAPKLGGYKKRIKEMVAENKGLPRKQRYTWKKIYDAIKQEGYEGSESNVRHYLAQLKWKKKGPAVFLPLAYDPGKDGQVDWGEAQVIMAGAEITVQLFIMRLSYSRRPFVMAFPNQRQEAFLLGHVKAFEHFGGVPQRLTYDNLKAAVYRVLQGRSREEQAVFVQFRSHYLFESNYCTPGMGHQKGGVEQEVGYIRRNFLVPLPQVSSYEELNAYLLAQCLKNDQRRVAGQGVSIYEAWQEEVGLLRPLPLEVYQCCVQREVILSPYSQVVIETNRYSVPTDQGVKQLLAKIYPFEVEIYRPGQKEPIARHPRSYGRQEDILEPVHYLPLLAQRPGALEHAKPIRQWRQTWPEGYEALLASLQARWPDGRGVREFITILRLHESHPPALIARAVQQALDYGCPHADGVTLCLRQLVEPEAELADLDLGAHPHLQALGQQPANLAAYNQLLGGD